MPDETLDPPERFRQRENLGALHEAARKGDIAELDADHAAESLRLSSRAVVLGVGTPARIVHALNSGMRLQPFRNPPAIHIVLAHAPRQRLGATQREPADEWTRDSARRTLDAAQPFGDRLASGD